jgi:hypothetical protein
MVILNVFLYLVCISVGDRAVCGDIDEADCSYAYGCRVENNRCAADPCFKTSENPINCDYGCYYSVKNYTDAVLFYCSTDDTDTNICHSLAGASYSSAACAGLSKYYCGGVTDLTVGGQPYSVCDLSDSVGEVAVSRFDCKAVETVCKYIPNCKIVNGKCVNDACSLSYSSSTDCTGSAYDCVYKTAYNQNYCAEAGHSVDECSFQTNYEGGANDCKGPCEEITVDFGGAPTKICASGGVSDSSVVTNAPSLVSLLMIAVFIYLL